MKTSCIRIGLAAAMAALSGQAQAIDKSWIVSNGTWGTGGNWFPAGAPGLADNVSVGTSAAAHDAGVTLNVSPTVASLSITDGMRVQTNGQKLTVTGSAYMSGRNSDGIFTYPSEIMVEQGAAATDFESGQLTVTQQATFVIRDGAVARVNGMVLVDSDSSIYGEGTLNLMSNAAVAMRVEGSIQPGIAGLTINQQGTGRIDLDGLTACNSPINVTLSRIDGSGFADLTINGDQLVDTLNEDIFIGANNVINMNLSGGWSMGGGTTLKAFANSDHPGSAVINGGALTFAGAMEFLGGEADLRFNCPVNLQSSAHADLGSGDRLQFQGPATVAGGSYTLGQGANTHFAGPTIVQGGVFTTVSTSQADGAVYFDAPTTWNGTVTVHGLVRQSDTGTVTGPTTVNAADGAFDMDGVDGHTAWNIGNSLVVNATYIDAPENNVYNGTLNISGGFLSRLTINLTPANASWSLSGVMNLGGVAEILTTRVEGSRFFVNGFGAVNVTGKVLVNADMICLANSTISIPAANATLRTSETTVVYPGAAFVGAGLLSNAPSGGLMLFDTVGLGGVGVANDGFFEVDYSAGSASIDRFVCGNTGEWHVQVGGLEAGTQHDRLVVTGAAGASLAGRISVEHVDVGNGVFIPHVGDAITVLNARNGITGTFVSNPISIVGDLAVFWTVEYNAADVTLRVQNIVARCPADFNGDGFVDFFDFDAFVGCFENNVCPPGRSADFNNDGFVDFFDYDAFVQAFEAGC